jgi:hypothetical protein
VTKQEFRHEGNAYASLPELEQVLATTTEPSELVPQRF